MIFHAKYSIVTKEESNIGKSFLKSNWMNALVENTALAILYFIWWYRCIRAVNPWKPLLKIQPWLSVFHLTIQLQQGCQSMKALMEDTALAILYLLWRYGCNRALNPWKQARSELNGRKVTQCNCIFCDASNALTPSWDWIVIHPLWQEWHQRSHTNSEAASSLTHSWD